MEKLSILFDANILADSGMKRTARTGVYFTAYNIFRGLLKRNDVELTLHADRRRRLERYLRRHFADAGGFRIVDRNRDPGRVDAFFSPGAVSDGWIRDHHPGISCYNILYDIIPVLHPGYFPHSQFPATMHMLDDFDANDHWFAISESSRNDVLRMGNGVKPEQMTVIPLAANERFRPERDAAAFAAVRNKYRIPGDKRYVLSLCTREPRKNLVNTIRAFVEFIEENDIDDLVYVLAGGIWGMFRDELRNSIAGFARHSDKIVEIGYVDDDDLALLYSNALWFVYTPHYEGFGLPPLEAMQCGCPVVASDNSSLPEVVGDAGILVDSRDVREHVDAYADYYRNPELRAERSRRGLERAKLFRWDRCVDVICGKIAADAEKKRSAPVVSIVVAANCHDAPAGFDAIRRTLDSVCGQSYGNRELIIVDCGHDAETSEQLAAYAIGANAAIRKCPRAGRYRAFNAALPDIKGEFAAFLPAGEGGYGHKDFIAASVAKLLEFAGDLSYADIAETDRGAERIRRSDAKKLPFGEHFSSRSVLVKSFPLRDEGGFAEQYGSAAYDELIMRWTRDGCRLVRVASVRFSVYGGNPRGSRDDGEFSRAFHDVFGETLGLSVSDAEDLRGGVCLRRHSAEKVAQLAGKLPFDAGGAALLEKLIRNRHLTRIMDEERRDWLTNSRHLLFGFIPLRVGHSGDAANSVTTYRLPGSIPLLKVVRREGARISYYLFNFLPVFRARRSRSQEPLSL